MMAIANLCVYLKCRKMYCTFLGPGGVKESWFWYCFFLHFLALRCINLGCLSPWSCAYLQCPAKKYIHLFMKMKENHHLTEPIFSPPLLELDSLVALQLKSWGTIRRHSRLAVGSRSLPSLAYRSLTAPPKVSGIAYSSRRQESFLPNFVVVQL
jgi:hypothetical protein